MSFLDGGGEIDIHKYHEAYEDRVCPLDFEPEQIYLTMLAMEPRRGAADAYQFPCKVKSLAKEFGHGYILKFCFLNSDLGEAPTTDLVVYGNGMLAYPGLMIIRGVEKAREGYLRSYEDSSDDWLRSLGSSLSIVG